MLNKLTKKYFKFLILIILLVNQNFVSVKAEPTNETKEIKLKATLSPSYILGPGDEIYIIDKTFSDIVVSNSPNSIQEYKLLISPDGYLSLPLPDGSQKNILAAGQNLDELSKEIRELYSESLIHPLLTIQISKYRPLNIYIGGQVTKPGIYRIESSTISDQNGNIQSKLDSHFNSSEFSIIEAIQIAGGLKPRANITDITLTRGNSKEKKILNLKALINNQSDFHDINLQPGDAIYISETNEIDNQAQSHVRLLGKLAYQDVPVSITGEAKTTGNFILPNNATIVDAIGKAGGLNEVGTLKIVELSRFDENGNYTTKKINVHDLINSSSKFEDIAVRPGDRINLVASKGKEVRHFFRENASTLINTTFGAFTNNFANFLVQDALVPRVRKTETITKGGGNGGIISVIGGN